LTRTRVEPPITAPPPTADVPAGHGAVTTTEAGEPAGPVRLTNTGRTVACAGAATSTAVATRDRTRRTGRILIRASNGSGDLVSPLPIRVPGAGHAYPIVAYRVLTPTRTRP